MARLTSLAEEYFSTLNPIASKIYEDIEDAKSAYENLWDTFTEKEKANVLNERIIKPEIALKYSLLETLDFDLNDPPSLRKDDIMSFFGREHGLRIVQDDNTTWRDEHSAPFMYQTKSQLNLCELSSCRNKEDKPGSPPVLSELALSHSKVVSELKNALKSHDMLKTTNFKEKTEMPTHKEEVSSPTGFISKFIGSKFRSRDEERERLVASEPQTQIVASSDNFFRTNFKSMVSPPAEAKFEKDYARTSIAKSSNDLSEENRGLLSSSASRDSSVEFQSCEDLGPKTASTETLTSMLPKTGYEFLDNW